MWRNTLGKKGPKHDVPVTGAPEGPGKREHRKHLVGVPQAGPWLGRPARLYQADKGTPMAAAQPRHP